MNLEAMESFNCCRLISVIGKFIGRHNYWCLCLTQAITKFRMFLLKIASLIESLHWSLYSRHLLQLGLAKSQTTNSHTNVISMANETEKFQCISYNQHAPARSPPSHSTHSKAKCQWQRVNEFGARWHHKLYIKLAHSKWQIKSAFKCDTADNCTAHKFQANILPQRGGSQLLVVPQYVCVCVGVVGRLEWREKLCALM